MKKNHFFIALALFLGACAPKGGVKTEENLLQPTSVFIDLQNVQDDKVNVKVNPGKLSSESVIYQFAQTVPGTYSTDNFGRLIDNFQAFDYSGKVLPSKKDGENKFIIENGSELDYVTYLVNDSFDIDGELGIFSPSGTNIKKDENFVLNLHGFVGYFNEDLEKEYNIDILRPKILKSSTAIQFVGTKETKTEGEFLDQFTAKRYFEVTDNPIFYTNSESSSFMVGDMSVVLDVYSPNGAYRAKDLLPNIQKMVNAQKNYLGEINRTDLYAILLYLSEIGGESKDANGFGALEHHTSTVVVFPESMPLQALNEGMTDVVSHEFFHTLTPLNVHSEEIYNFDYAHPKMSKHLWMYEGVTEYFANHFQVHEKLIQPEDFFARMMTKIESAKQYNDTMPFTEMSENVLKEEYEPQYMNVYMKGALIAMCLDIRLRELSNGKTGLLHLMGQLSEKYGKDKPFQDDELIPTIVELTDPQIANFFSTYMTGSTPIPYNQFFEKVGLEMSQKDVESSLFMLGMRQPFFSVKEDTKEIYFPSGMPFNSMLEKLGVKGDDVLKTFNGKPYDLDNIRQFVFSSMMLKEGASVTMTVMRNGAEVKLSGIYEQPVAKQNTLIAIDLKEDDAKLKLRNNWLYN